MPNRDETTFSSLVEIKVMGMDQKIVVPSDKIPTWPALVKCLAAKNFPIDLRMIDGELAFPDDLPPDTWRELRVGTSAGMITLRRDEVGITLVIWGNADLKMRQAWNALTWSLAHLTGGVIRTSDSEHDLAAFLSTAELPAGFS
jgi:hypothetical protein